nr:hypothetical protein [Tanacetum cinerariifolium]
ITSITVNGKDAYELKGKFLDDLHDNSFSGTNGEDTVEHIQYFLKIVNLVDLPNVNYERLRLAVFLISLVENASKWFGEFKGSITNWVDLTKKFFEKYYPPSRNVMESKAKKDPTNTIFEEWLASKFSNHRMMGPPRKFYRIFGKRIVTNLFDYETPLCTEFKRFNYLVKVDTKLFTYDIERTNTYEEYESKLNNEFGEPWSKDGVPYEICDHICEPFRFKNEKTKWPTYGSNEDGFCNGGELPRMIQVGYMTYFHDYEWYDELTDSSLKEEALKQMVIYEKSWGDATQIVQGGRYVDSYPRQGVNPIDLSYVLAYAHNRQLTVHEIGT